MNPLDEDMTAFVRYRLEKAEEAYTAARILYDAQQWNAAVLGAFSEHMVRTNKLPSRSIRKHQQIDIN